MFEEIEVLNFNADDADLDEDVKYLVVIVYDIIDNKRRNKISKKLLSYGNRVQKSVFECLLSMKKYKKLIKELPKFIDEKEDFLRIYRLPMRADLEIWGNVGYTEERDFFFV